MLTKDFSIRLISTGLLGSLFLLSCAGRSETNPEIWALEWQDEFNGARGTAPDSTKWGYDIGTGWGNQQLEFDTDLPRNASMDGEGNLAITAYEESYENRAYTSARIVSRDKFEPTYGKYEARIKMPTGQGMWPAFWLLGADIARVGWPQCGEIDIMEYRGQEPHVIQGTVHGPGYSGSAGIDKSMTIQGDRFDENFHIFSVEWRPESIRWYMDNTLYHEVEPEDLPGKWVFDHPYYLILNLAVGGSYVGAPDSTTVFPQSLLVDYVRVYKLITQLKN